ncbi:MAG: hypothetical protein RL065_464 [Bacteroidota bacterium]
MVNCSKLIFSGDALQKMFSRNIAESQIRSVVEFGQIIKSYEDDKPHPSYLMLSIVNLSPLHVVVAKDKTDDSCIIITAYYPNEQIWNSDFKTKK